MGYFIGTIVEPLYQGPLKYGYLSNQDTISGSSYIEKCTCTKQPLKLGHLFNLDASHA